MKGDAESCWVTRRRRLLQRTHGRCAVAHASNPDEVSDRDNTAADDKQEPCARDQVRNDQKHQPAKQRHDGALLPSVHEEPQPDRAKEKTQKQRRSSYLGHARRYPAGQGRDAFIASAATVCWVSICDTAALQPTCVENTRECRGWHSPVPEVMTVGEPSRSPMARAPRLATSVPSVGYRRGCKGDVGKKKPRQASSYGGELTGVGAPRRP